MRAGVLACALTLSMVPSAAQAKESTKINRPENVELYSSTGDPMIRVTLKESLPNAFGGADLFGRKRDRGFVQITFAGIRDGRAVFWRRGVDVISDETTMSRSGIGSFSGSATQVGNSTYFSGTTTRAPQASISALPAGTIEMALDLTQSRFITIEDRTIEIISADAGGVKFVVKSAKRK